MLGEVTVSGENADAGAVLGFLLRQRIAQGAGVTRPRN